MPPAPPIGAVHKPELHVPFEQGVPSAAIGEEHCPVCGEQVPSGRQSAAAAQVFGFEPVHTPATQESV